MTQTDETAGETKTWEGGCHCGRVRYAFSAASFSPLVSCNCSICEKRGLILTFVPEDKFQLLSGQDGLTDYLFNKKVIHHNFCANCGVESFARGIRPDGVKMVAINVRCVDGIDLTALSPRPVNGKAL